MASPSAKYSKRARSMTSASASATTAVEPHNTRPTTTGMSTAAVTILFQVMKGESPVGAGTLHHIVSRRNCGTFFETQKSGCNLHYLPAARGVTAMDSVELAEAGWRRPP